MENRKIVLTVTDGIAFITLNRPDAMNAVDIDAAEQFAEAVAEVEAEPHVRCVVLRGAGRHFTAGGDVKLFHATLAMSEEERASVFERILGFMNPAITGLRSMPKPVLTSVQGVAAGLGVSLIGASDLAIAADDAVFTLAFGRIGGTPDSGASFALPRMLGAKRASQLVFLGDRFDARQALDWGLVNWVVPSADLARQTDDLAARLAAGPTGAFGRAKALLQRSLETDLASQLEAERESFVRSSNTREFREGLSSLLEKREPDFRRVSSGAKP
ncbi:MAG TPA: enoyl-CoA hydratase-related protein [Microvirga sp.]|nr:enoyl-CoA hydratase-related protein [Microvirga sp.]